MTTSTFNRQYIFTNKCLKTGSEFHKKNHWAPIVSDYPRIENIQNKKMGQFFTYRGVITKLRAGNLLEYDIEKYAQD